MWGDKPMSLRRFRNLALNMPMSGAVGERLGHVENQNWDWSIELLAMAVEAVIENTRVFITANQRKGDPTPKQILLPRPYRKPKPKRAATSTELATLFGKQVRYVPLNPSENEG